MSFRIPPAALIMCFSYHDGMMVWQFEVWRSISEAFRIGCIEWNDWIGLDDWMASFLVVMGHGSLDRLSMRSSSTAPRSFWKEMGGRVTASWHRICTLAMKTGRHGVREEVGFSYKCTWEVQQTVIINFKSPPKWQLLGGQGQRSFVHQHHLIINSPQNLDLLVLHPCS